MDVPDSGSLYFCSRCLPDRTNSSLNLEVGDSITEGTLIEWTKSIGDSVELDEVIGIIETDKVSVDVRAPVAGKIVAQHAAVDDNIEVGSPLLDIEEGAAGAAAAPATEAASEAPVASAAPESTGEMFEMKVPDMGDSITEILKQPGDAVAVDEVIAVIETDKVSVDVRSPVAGKLTALAAAVDDAVEVGADLFVIEVGAAGAAASPAPAAAEAPAAAASAPAAAETKAAAPAASKPAPASSSSAAAEESTSSGGAGYERSEERVKMTRMRQTIARRLKSAQNTCAMLTTFNEVDMTAAMELRKAYKDDFEKAHGARLGFMSFFIKAVTAALEEV